MFRRNFGKCKLIYKINIFSPEDLQRNMLCASLATYTHEGHFLSCDVQIRPISICGSIIQTCYEYFFSLIDYF